MKQKLPIFAAAALLALANLTRAAEAPAEPSKWRFDASLNLFLAGMSGDVTAKGIPAEVDASFSQIFENLEAGAAGRFTLGYERWSLSTEFSYLRLAAGTSLIDAELEQWLVEPTIGYRLNQFLEPFAGARYNNISGDVTFKLLATRVATGTQDWWDPIVGVNLSLPLLRDKVSLIGRFDVGGFGAGSDLTWQAFPALNWRFAKWGSAQLGYRWLGTDYETGSGPNKFRYDVILQGPQIGLTSHF